MEEHRPVAAARHADRDPGTGGVRCERLGALYTGSAPSSGRVAAGGTVESSDMGPPSVASAAADWPALQCAPETRGGATLD